RAPRRHRPPPRRRALTSSLTPARRTRREVQMTYVIPAEADWDSAPGLLDGAMSLVLTAEQCNLAYWLAAVAQGTLRNRVEYGHAPEAATPAYMREPGPLRDALVMELGYRSVAEEKATRILAHYVAGAPGIPEMEFYSTQ